MKILNERINQLISLADKALTVGLIPTRHGYNEVKGELFNEFRTSCLSFIINVYGEKHPYYLDFNKNVSENYQVYTEHGRGILKAIKSEIDGGWLTTIKGIISAEIFSDFLEMAEHLLNEKYKDPAAVMIGSVLEEHLKQLCIKNGISTEEDKLGKIVPKKADLLNAELSGASVYNKLDQKNVTAWLDLRNKAAHGKYSEYNNQQVELMLHAVIEFIARNSL